MQSQTRTPARALANACLLVCVCVSVCCFFEGLAELNEKQIQKFEKPTTKPQFWEGPNSLFWKTPKRASSHLESRQVRGWLYVMRTGGTGSRVLRRSMFGSVCWAVGLPARPIPWVFPLWMLNIVDASWRVANGKPKETAHFQEPILVEVSNFRLVKCDTSGP